MTQNEQDAIDARRWRAIRLRHPATLCRMATGGASFSSVKAPALIDAWGDMVAAEVDAFDYDRWQSVELPQIVADAERATAQTEQERNGWEHELGAVDVAQRADSYAGALRVLHGLADRGDRLAAIGNGQVPRVVAEAWRLLTANP